MPLTHRSTRRGWSHVLGSRNVSGPPLGRTAEVEELLEAGAVGQVGGLDGAAGPDVVEGGADLVEGRAGELGPGEAVEGELEGVGGRVAAGLPVDDEEAAACVGGLGVDRVDAAADDLTPEHEGE